VVIHRSAFYHEMNGDLENGGFNFDNPKPGVQPEEIWQRLYDIADDKLIAFIGLVGTQYPHTKFLVYSRGTDVRWMAEEWRNDTWVPGVVERFPALKGRITTMLVEKVGDSASFYDKVNEDTMRTHVQEILHLEKKPR